MFQIIWLMQEYMVLAKIGVPFHLYNFPHMDVVKFGIFKFCHKTEDIVKHYNHDPILIHKRT